MISVLASVPQLLWARGQPNVIHSNVAAEARCHQVPVSVKNPDLGTLNFGSFEMNYFFENQHIYLPGLV